jgi:hypothetical protein
MKQFKIRCSAISQIMGIGKDAKPITEIQLGKIKELQEKPKLTEKQNNDLQDLIAKRDHKPTINEILPETCKNYLETWAKEQLYNRRKDFYSKYCDKGTTCEPASIEFLSEQLGWGFVLKNEQQFENDFMTGEPDVVLPTAIKEIKNSWDCFTFPLFDTEPDKAHVWQVQGYMALTGATEAQICYVLMDMPEHLIQRQVNFEAHKLGLMELDAETEAEIREQYLYSKLAPELRIKAFTIYRSEEAIAAIEQRVKECREYLQTLKF